VHLELVRVIALTQYFLQLHVHQQRPQLVILYYLLTPVTNTYGTCTSCSYCTGCGMMIMMNWCVSYLFNSSFVLGGCAHRTHCHGTATVAEYYTNTPINYRIYQFTHTIILTPDNVYVYIWRCVMLCVCI
jgi:hypothetical protein